MKVTNDIEELISDIKNGKIVCFKTDTIWGLSANPFNKEAIENLYRIKKRKINKPFIFLIKKDENLDSYVKPLTINENNLISKIWPGPISIIFDYNQQSHILDFYQEQRTIALRNPKNKLCQNILNSLPYPLPSTSVNIEGNAPINNLRDLKKFLKNEDVTIYKKHYANKNASSSTLIKIKDKNLEIIRAGTLNKKY